MSNDQAPETRQPHSWLRIWAEIAGAWAISIAYPLYSNIAAGPEALTSYGMRRFDVLALILVVSLLGPLVIMLAELVIRRLFGEPARRIVQGVVVGVLLALVVWQWLVGQGSGTIVRNVLPIVMAGLIAWLYVKTELVRNFALMLSFATVVVIGAFAIDYPIRDELLPHEAKASTPGIDAETPVVLVIFDELPLAALEKPDGTIDPRFKTFSMLSRTSSWYPGAVSVADQTTFALPSILTGEDPDPTGGNEPPAPGASNYPNSICRIAEDGGYTVHSYEPITDLCVPHWNLGTQITASIRRAVGADSPAPPDPLAPGALDQKIARALNSPFDLPWTEIDTGRREAFRDFVGGLPDDPRSLGVLHIALPHVMWRYNADGTSYEDFRPAADTLLINPSTNGEIKRNAQQMMLQLKFTDRELGKLIRKMKVEGTWDESLFIVTADHGAAFERNGSRRILDSKNQGWIMPVPLFVKFPGQQRGQVVRGTVDGRDIAPTVLNALGLEPLEDMNGTDLTGRDSLPVKKANDVVDTIGGRIEVELAPVERERRRASRFFDRVLGQSFYAPGGHADLLGKPPRGLSDVGYEATDASLYEDVDTTADEIPAYFQGRLDLPEGSPYPGPMAISLNGKVAATTDPWRFGDSWYTGVVLPTAGFRDGANEIRVYEIKPGD
ncbi:MAG: sulfatase-like hydrolase/transferase [Solirubrobacterales bacterium]|nr:sulfatase-like hydrolase/transferase [Solirubrobacterales bacterium]